MKHMPPPSQPPRASGPLAQCVRVALERYFADLDGAEPEALHDLVVAQIEPPLLQFVMERTQGNQCEAARLLGINRNTLRKKLRLYQMGV